MRVLAIDLGTGGPKVAVVDAVTGDCLDEAFEPVELVLCAGGGAEQDPETWWRAVCACAARLDRTGVAAVAVTGQWAGTVACDAGGAPLANAVIWLDARGAPYARRVAGRRLGPAGYDPRKLVTWIRLTGGAPSLSGRDPVGHILFLQHERPEVFAAARLLLEPVDWLNLRLSGRAVTAAETATLHWATDTRDLSRVHYDERLLAAAGLPREKLPEIVPTGSVAGTLTGEAAGALGLPAGLPVATATPDTCSAAIGSGAVADFAGHLYVGTSSWLSCHVPFKRTDPLHSIASLPSSVPGRYLVSTEQETAGGALAHLRDALLDAHGTPFDDLVALAAAEPPGSRGVIFTPWLNGERTPVDDHLVRGGFFNLGLDTTRGLLVRATLEGVALNARWMHGYVERFVRRRVDDLAFIGGGARSPVWAQIFADVLGRRVRRIADPVQANVRGAAFIAAAALGGPPLATAAQRVRTAGAHDPDRSLAPLYGELFGDFRRLYRANRRIYARLNAPRTGAAA